MGYVRTVVYMLAVIATISGHEHNDVSLGGSYNLVETVLMQDLSKEPVGYQVTGILNVQRVHSSFLLLQLLAPKLHIMSRKAPTPHGFVAHTSQLDSAFNNPFLLKLEDGKVQSLYADPLEKTFMLNIKRGISGLFQFQTDDIKQQETDSSGICNVTYTRSLYNIVKVKSGCKPEFPPDPLKDNLWGGKLTSLMETLITLSDDGKRLENLVAKESHILRSNIAKFAVTKVTTEIELAFKGDLEETIELVNGDEESALREMGKHFGEDFRNVGLSPEKEPPTCNNEGCPDLSTIVRENKKHLKVKEMGTSKSALAMIRLVHAVNDASPENIYRVINSKENKEILPQLMDVLGAAQTEKSHQAALKKLQINTDYKLDLCERYFWGLSMSPQPKKAIIKDVMQMMSSPHKDPKLWQTIVFSLAAMTHNYHQNSSDDELVKEVIKLIEGNLKDCKKDDENCRQLYLKALSNIPSPFGLPTLLKHAVGFSQKSSLAAIFAISKLGVEHWGSEVLKLAERVFLTNESDSSARTIALDMLLETNPSEVLLAKLLSTLRNKETPTELKEYLLQRLYQISEWDKDFHKVINAVLHKEGLYHYNTLAQGGLSTAFTRTFMEGGSLSTTQEVSSGILKRGNVHVNLQYNNVTHTLFTLGIFSKGLGSFVSDNSNEGQDEESASAGLELSVLGVGLRPFVFFDGQGELMGHVWSGTGSTKTPAYQALLLLGKEKTSIALGIGFLADLSILSAASVDLSGKIEISIWNRNAVSLVQNSAGVALEGTIQIDSSLVKTKIDFNLMAEPRLDLSSNIEFSDNFALCLQLQQPNSSVRYNTFKVERIPGSKHKLRKTRYKTIFVPGKSYALNMKNSEMCNLIFNDS